MFLLSAFFVSANFQKLCQIDIPCQLFGNGNSISIPLRQQH